MFIIEVDAGVECILSKSADGTKPGGAADCLEGKEALQRDLGELNNYQRHEFKQKEMLGAAFGTE